MARTSKYDISEKTLRELERKAVKGDYISAQELIRINTGLAKQTNAKLLALEKNNMDYYAYDRVTFYTQQEYGKTRFPTSKKIDISDIAQNIREMRTFNSAKSSTVKGQIEIAQERFSFLDANGFGDMPERQKTALLRFLGSESAHGMMQVFGDSEKVVSRIFEARKTKVDSNGQLVKGKNIAEIRKAFDNYQKAYSSYSKGKGVQPNYNELFSELGIDVTSKPLVRK